MHSHAHDDTPAQISRRIRLILTGVMTALFTLTVAAMIALWPNADEIPAKRPYLAEGATLLYGEVVATYPAEQGGHIVVDLDETGERVLVNTSPQVPASEISVGDNVTVIDLPAGYSGSGETNYVFVDFQRGTPLLVLALLFVVVVVAVARRKGAAALVGLIGALACIWLFLLPALTAGRNPLLVALTAASAIMFIVVYLAHGISVKTTTALLGTFAGVAVVVIGAWIAIPAVHLTPRIHDEMAWLESSVPGINLAGVLLCGMVLAGVGVLNDVTITQASAVWELRAAEPHATRFEVFTRAMRIGRDHIASTVYTIAFAYVGSALALLTLTTMMDYTLDTLLTFEDIAEELVPTFVASIALVLTIPLTTAIGAWLAGGAAAEQHLDAVTAATEPLADDTASASPATGHSASPAEYTER
ncbi:MAG: YibE/F family protein [Propionibacteriaceae bacterium]|jgi:uncharacterized membrane protein|nr:YibE/F family protein [Propionibacteriaceae bacterium]